MAVLYQYIPRDAANSVCCYLER